jgi:hypothetical protein
VAKFWSEHKNLITGDTRHPAVFHNGTFVTEDPDVIEMLRKKAKIPELGIVEVTPREDETEKSLAIKTLPKKAKE